jgi:hypothetical protein
MFGSLLLHVDPALNGTALLQLQPDQRMARYQRPKIYAFVLACDLW